MLPSFKQRRREFGLLLVLFSLVGIALLRLTMPAESGVNVSDISASGVIVNPLLPIQEKALQLSPAREPIVPIPLKIAVDSRKVALGRQLFHNPQLSKTGKMSCASCHDLQRAGIDHLPQSLGNIGKALARNSPTIFNSGFNFKQFWDGRVDSLEAQIDASFENPKAMAISWAEVISELTKSPQYQRAFSTIYGKDGIQPSTVRDAIATFERSLITPNARFDQFLRGNDSAITAAEKAGYERFKSYGCIACHQGMNVGGNLFQPIGAMKSSDRRSEQAKADLGRFKVTNKQADLYVFKVPSLRNVALTAPYFHDGHIKTLEEAVKTMADYQLGRAISDQDVTLIVDFLRTLTGQFPQASS